MGEQVQNNIVANTQQNASQNPKRGDKPLPRVTGSDAIGPISFKGGWS